MPPTLRRLLCAVLVAAFMAAGPALADDVMILDGPSHAVISGRVTGVDRQGLFTMDHNGVEIVVSTADLEIGAESLGIAGEGVYVTVEGSLETGDILEARRVVRSEEPVIVDDGIILDKTDNAIPP